MRSNLAAALSNLEHTLHHTELHVSENAGLYDTVLTGLVVTVSKEAAPSFIEVVLGAALSPCSRGLDRYHRE